ncbi:hypothetical protein E2320_011297, partial [Naja naja]
MSILAGFFFVKVLDTVLEANFCVTKKRKRIKKMRDYKTTCRQ